MPSDLYAERIRLVSGSQPWTISVLAGSDPNGVRSEPTGSLLRSSDGGIWINSNGGTEWQRLGNGVVTGSYTAVGTEGSQITVTLPVAFASNQYKVFVTNASGSSVSAYQVPENLRTTTNFKINSTAPFAANDKLDYLAVSGSIYAGTSGASSNVVNNPLKAVFTGSALAISNSETQVLSFNLPANTLTVGSVIGFVMHGNRSGNSSTSPSVRVRIGQTSLAGAVCILQQNVNTTNSGGNRFEGSVYITSIGASGNAVGDSVGSINNAAATPSTVAMNNGRIDSVTVDTTVDNIVEITMTSETATNTYTVRGAQLWLHPSPN